MSLGKSKKYIIRVDPLPQKETAARVVGKIAQFYTPPKKREYMLSILKKIQQYKGDFKGCKLLRAHFIFKIRRPKCLKKSQLTEFWHGLRPDLDNLEKSLQDCLGHSVIDKKKKRGEYVKTHAAKIIDDDSVICQKISEKLFCRADKNPCIVVILTEITSPIYERLKYT